MIRPGEGEHEEVDVGYMLAKIQVRYGQTPRLNEVMPAIVAGMEAQGWRLLGAWQTRIGPFNEVWDLWDLGGGASAIEEGLDRARQDPAFLQAASQLPEIVEHEEVRYLEALPYGPAADTDPEADTAGAPH